MNYCNEYKQMITNIYDAICAALTNYETTCDSTSYDKGTNLYLDIVDIQERLSEFIN